MLRLTRRSRAVRLSLLLIACAGAECSALADTGATEVASEPGRLKPPLAPLPKAPSRRLKPATAGDLQSLEDVLSRIRSLKGADVQAGLAEHLVVDSSLLPAVKDRLDQEAEKADRARMKRLLLDIRSDAREQIENQMRQSGVKGKVETPDYLEMVLSYPKGDPKIFASLANVLALSRICKKEASIEALRILVHVYVRFDFLRIDTQLQLQDLGDQALPALLESTRHPAPKVANWAHRQLDFLGKAIPSEAVQVDDPQVLADILRAYGRLRDPDAARLVVSFANSERAQVREAARQSIGLFGEVANWQLRDTYEKMVGERPPRDWSWDRTAKELFREFDLIRLAELYRFYDLGMKAKANGELEQMRDAFEKVLSRDPNFEPSEQIGEGFLAYGLAKLNQVDGSETESLEAAMPALERAARIAEAGPSKAKAESLLLYAQARRQTINQLAEQLLLRRALELDPENELAADLLDEISREPLAETGSFMRFLWPGLLLLVSLASAALVIFRRPKTEGAEA